MKTAIFSPGGVGGYFGGRLALAGHEVHFIARGEHLEAIRHGGLRVDSVSGDFVADPASATSDPTDIGSVDVLVFAVKTWQLSDAAQVARPLVGHDTVVLPLLNGVEATETLASVFGEERVLGGLCQISAHVRGPGHVVHTAIEPKIVFGEMDNRVSDRVTRIRDAFVDAGVDAERAEDITAALWEKFMLIATWSGIGAITRAPIGVWRELPGTRSMAEAALREILTVALARGVSLSHEKVADTLQFFDGVAPEGTASMQKDVIAGRPSEVEAQNGAVVRMASDLGVPVPTHELIYSALLPQERLARAGVSG